MTARAGHRIACPELGLGSLIRFLFELIAGSKAGLLGVDRPQLIKPCRVAQAH